MESERATHETALGLRGSLAGHGPVNAQSMIAQMDFDRRAGRNVVWPSTPIYAAVLAAAMRAAPPAQRPVIDALTVIAPSHGPIDWRALLDDGTATERAMEEQG